MYVYVFFLLYILKAKKRKKVKATANMGGSHATY